MAVNKVVINRDGVEDVLVDLTNDSVDADALTVGFTAHSKTGETVEGANPYEKTATDTTVGEQADLIQQIQAALEGKAAGSGGGGSLAAHSVTVDASALKGGFGMYVLCVCYIKPDGTCYEDTLCVNGIYTQTYTDINGLLCLYDAMDSGLIMYKQPATFGNIENRFIGYSHSIFMVYGDGTITLT